MLRSRRWQAGHHGCGTRSHFEKHRSPPDSREVERGRERSPLDHYMLRVSLNPSKAPTRPSYKDSSPVGIFGLPLRFLPLWGRNFTFNGEGNAIGTWHAQAGGIASDLAGCEQDSLGWGMERRRRNGLFVRGRSGILAKIQRLVSILWRPRCRGFIEGMDQSISQMWHTSHALDARCLFPPRVSVSIDMFQRGDKAGVS